MIIVIITSAFLLACQGQDQGKDEKELVIYNWGDYMDPALIEKFEKQEGIRVIYNEYATNEDLFVKLKNSNEQIDLIIPSDYMLERLINRI